MKLGEAIYRSVVIIALAAIACTLVAYGHADSLGWVVIIALILLS